MPACVSCNAPSQYVFARGAGHECYACGHRWQGMLVLHAPAREPGDAVDTDAPRDGERAHEQPREFAVIAELRQEGRHD